MFSLQSHQSYLSDVNVMNTEQGSDSTSLSCFTYSIYLSRVWWIREKNIAWRLGVKSRSNHTQKVEWCDVASD